MYLYSVDIEHSYEYFLEQVQHCAHALAIVPLRYKTFELSLTAVKKNAITLQWVPMPLRDVEMCDAAINENPIALAYTPQCLRTYERCLYAMKLYGGALKSVPKEHRTFELCVEAVKSYSIAQNETPIFTTRRERKAWCKKPVPRSYNPRLLRAYADYYASPIPVCFPMGFVPKEIASDPRFIQQTADYACPAVWVTSYFVD